MKKLITLSLTSAILLSSNVKADGFLENTEPYIGNEYIHTWMGGKGYWADLVENKFDNVGVFLGIKITDHWGLELGHNQSTKKNNQRTYVASANIFNETIPAQGLMTAGTSVKLFNTYLDLIGYWEMAQDWTFLASVGFSWTKAKINEDGVTTNAAVDAAGLNAPTDIRGVKADAKIVPQVGFGTEYKYNNWRFRGRLLWKNTNRLRLTDTRPNVSNIYYKDSLGLSFGVAYYFFE